MPKLPLPATNAIEDLFKQCYINPAIGCRNYLPSRRYATRKLNSNSHHPIREVAVLGGGITGLTSAYYLSKALPNTKITLFEATSRLGGWLRSKTVNVGNGNIIFEQGPRSLRPNTPSVIVTLDLISKLGLVDMVLRTPQDSTAAQNRFLYFPDHLVHMPNSLSIHLIFKVLTEPVFKGIITGVLRDISAGRNKNWKDESVGSFISRRFGPSLADNILSAVYHGIYAGDIYQLSARSLFPALWLTEKYHSSLVRALITRAPVPYLKEDLLLSKNPLSVNMVNTSTFTLAGGLGILADAIAADLERNPNVTIRRGVTVNAIGGPGWNPRMKIQISSSSKMPSPKTKSSDFFSHVISTIPGTKLSTLLDVPPLSLTPSVTVMVVNFFFSNPGILPVRGFGYLIPRSVPFEENPELALGVIFDSDAVKSQDTVPGTKVTVMLGGHWWDGWDSYPDEEQGANMAKAVLKRHLGVNEEPGRTLVSLQKHCIPQYTVGHEDRMADASQMLRKYEGKLRVAGSSYTGVGVNDCIRAAWDAVGGLVEGTAKTGLETFEGGRNWVWLSPSDLKRWRTES